MVFFAGIIYLEHLHKRDLCHARKQKDVTGEKHVALFIRIDCHYFHGIIGASFRQGEVACRELGLRGT